MSYTELVNQLKQLPDVDIPTLEARLILEKTDKTDEINRILKRREKGEPLSKILGERGFWKLILKVNQNVLDPRPDSEILIESVLNYFTDKTKPYRIVDFGTGSGCLLLSLLTEYPNATGVGVDKSEKALEIAEENGKSFEKASFVHASWNDFQSNPFDIIISNPPYIPSQEIDTLEDNVRLYDPMEALDGGKDGLVCYRELSEKVFDLLNPNGKIFLEIGQGQENEVKAIFERKGFSLVEARKDYGGIIRCLVFSK